MGCGQSAQEREWRDARQLWLDGNGKRVKKTESGVTTYYVISSVLGAAMEVTSSGVQRAYVMSGSSVVAQLNPNGSFYWLQQDHLGSGRKMTDSTGALVYRAEFDPYGKLLYEWSSPSNLNSRKFTGYERDAATNLDYAQARMYSSDWGRFMSPDPMGLGAARLTSPKSLNRYSYTEGNPVNFVDRRGLFIGNPPPPAPSAPPPTLSIPTLDPDGQFDIEAPPEDQGGEPEPVELGPDDLRRMVYSNESLVKKINDCLKQLLTPAEFAKVGQQSINNAPRIDATRTAEQMTQLLDPNNYAIGKMGYAYGVGPGQTGDLGGNNGTIHI